MSLPDRRPNPFADSAPNPYVDPPNPYAPPQVASYQPFPVGSGQYDGLWRQGNVLVMHKSAQLPAICVKSNEPATQWLVRKLQWHPQWVLLLVFVNILICAVVALILTKRATISIGLTDEWMARRKTRLFIAWSLGLIALALIVTAIVVIVQGGPNAGPAVGVTFGIGLLSGIFLGLGAVIYGQYACRLIYAEKVTDSHIWIKGVHPAFLDRLDVWAGT